MMGSMSYSFLFGVAFKSTAVLATASMIVLLLHRRSAAVRHLVWSATLTGALVLPILSVTLPAVHAPAVEAFLPAGLILQADASSSLEQARSSAKPHPGKGSTAQTTPWLPDWRLSLLLIWVAGATISLSQMGIGWATMQRFRRKARKATMPGFATLLGSLEIKNQVGVLEAARGSMPMTYGVLRPVIFTPLDINEWSEERRRVVLLHELAHVRRRDSATQLLARAALALYWWNPLAWIAWHEFLKEREKAADDMVLALGTSAPEYATHLVEIARSRQSHPVLGWATVAAARPSQLEGRILAILDSRRSRRIPRRASAIAATVAAIGIVIPLSAVQAQGNRAQTSFQLQQNMGVAAAFIKSGDLEREEGKFDVARNFYRKALAASSSGPDRAASLIRLGTVDLAAKDKDVEQAVSNFEQAQAADPAKAGEAAMWIAIAREQQNNLTAAAAFFQSALAAETPNSPSAATIMELYAQLLRQQSRKAEAGAMESQAAAIRKAQGAQAISTRPSSGEEEVYRIGRDVTAPVLVSKTEPKYTAEARLAKYQGRILLFIEVDKNGFARNIRITSGLGFGLNDKATEALSQWRFKPAMHFGQPVTVMAQVEVNFRLL